MPVRMVRNSDGCKRDDRRPLSRRRPGTARMHHRTCEGEAARRASGARITDPGLLCTTH